MLKKFFIHFFLVGWWLIFTGYFSYAQEITLLYTGDTQAMLYPCRCPVKRDGGIARRATLIKELRKKNPDILLVDAGRFFAGGLTDEYTQNTDLDMQRTQVNLKAMEIMKYDCLAISEDEFNFGREFLEENIQNSNLTFISSNIKSKKILPYLVREITGTKIGIISLAPLSARGKAGGLRFIKPKIALKEAVKDLKKQAVGIIILLSNLDENQSLSLIKEIPEVNILIMGRSHTGRGNFFEKVGSTLVLKPAWQGRRLGKASLILKKDKIADYKIDEIRISDQIKDDPEILSILPKCFSDNDCHKVGFISQCKNEGTLKALCKFTKPPQISLLIITPKVCRVCKHKQVVNSLKKHFLGLRVSYLYYPNAKAKKLIKDFAIKQLPAYLLAKVIEKEKQFGSLRNKLEIKGDFYKIKPEFSGIAYFIERKRIKGNLDLFISLYDQNATRVLDTVREFNPRVHFLAVERRGRLDAAGGNLEVEEYLRSVCVKKYYPGYFWNYISCRAKNIDNSWWEDCLSGLDAQEIKNCAKGEEGKLLLKDNISLNKELEVMFGPTYLLDNQEIFSSKGVPNKEELRRILKR